MSAAFGNRSLALSASVGCARLEVVAVGEKGKTFCNAG
jgi:hypothetical protein